MEKAKIEEIFIGVENNSMDYQQLRLMMPYDYLKKDDNGVTYLERMIENDNFRYFFRFLIDDEIIEDLLEEKEAIYLFLKHGRFKDIRERPIKEWLFFEPYENDLTLADIAFQNKDNLLYFVGFFKNDTEIVDYTIKYNKLYDDFSKELVEKLFKDRNGTFLVDKYLNNSELIKKLINYYSSDLIIDYCKKKNNYSILRCAKEDLLLHKLDDGRTILDILLENNEKVSFLGRFTNKETIDILVKYGRLDLLYKAKLSLLLTPVSNEKTYFDLMIEEQKQGHEMHFDSVDYSTFDQMECVANALIALARNDLLVFVPNIDYDMLFNRWNPSDKRVFEWLLELDRDLTISKIIPLCNDKNDEEFVLGLKSYGIDATTLDLKYTEVQLADEYINSYNENYLIEYQSPDEDLLKELKELFYSDGKSDKHAVDLLIGSYRYLTSIDSPYSRLEIRQLIEIKKNNMDKFLFTMIKSGSYFNRSQGVCLDDYIISTIHHEVSHALHWYLSDYYIPDNYFEVIKNIRNNPETLKKVQEYSKKFHDIRKQIYDSVSQSKISEYYDSLYTGDRLFDISNFLSSAKDEQRKKYQEKYSPEVLDTLLCKTYSIDEYIDSRKKIAFKEVTDAKIRNEYDAFIAIGDIIDAIYFGRFRNGALVNEEGSYIEHAYGHGIDYYQRPDAGFIEMIANYGSMIKSKNANQVLEYLRYIVGDELVDMIETVYKNNVIYSQKYGNGIDLEMESNYAR